MTVADNHEPAVRTDAGVTMSRAQRESFHELYAAHAHGVYATALAILKDADAAHDVAQDVFLRAWQRADQYDPSRGAIGVWLRAVARHLSIDRLRSARRVTGSESLPEDASRSDADGLSQLLTREQLIHVRNAFQKLPPMHRQLIELSYDKELSHTDIAELLKQPLGTIKSRIRQAQAMLRAYAGRLDPAEPTVPWLNPPSQAFTTSEIEDRAAQVRLRQVPPLRVLVVDDDEETLRLVSAVLRKFGIAPETRTSARAGLAALLDCWPDVLISDLNMPDEDGYALIGNARAVARDRSRRLRAAAFTSWAGEQERSRALVAGYDLYINKPVHPLALVGAVAALGQ